MDRVTRAYLATIVKLALAAPVAWFLYEVMWP